VIKEFWLIPSLLWRGTKKLSYQDLRDRVDTLMSTLDIDGHGGIVIAGVKSERRHVKEMLELTMHMMMESNFTPEEFAIVKQREIDNYEEIKSDPQRLGFQELERLKNPWPKGDIHYVHSFDEIIEGLSDLSLESTKKAYQMVMSTDHCSMAVVGDVDQEMIFEELSRLIPEHKGLLYKRIKRPFINNDVKEIMLNCPDKEMAIVAQAFNFPMRDDHPDFAALKIANYMFGENMNSRLMNRIREKEGISYGAGSHIDISRHEETACFNIYAMAAPDSVSRAKRAIDEEWQRFLKEGIGDTELKNAQESIWLTFENVLANDGYVANALARDMEVNRDFFYRENFYLRIKALKTDEVMAAMHRWWGKGAFSRVTACDLQRLL
jgi:zinc protease